MDVLSCVCVVCNKVPEAVIESLCCNSLFCWNCAIKLTDAGQTCPGCDSQLYLDQFRENYAIQKLIDNMIVGCKFEGCTARFNFPLKQEHENSCDHAPVLCPNSDLCGIMSRSALEIHLVSCEYRHVECNLCEIPVMVKDLDSHVSNDCPESIVECINKCGIDNIVRSSMDQHLLEECPLFVVECPYKAHGCNEEFQRESTAAHLQSRAGVHLQLLSPYLEQSTVMQNELVDIRNELSRAREEIDELKKETNALRSSGFLNAIIQTLQDESFQASVRATFQGVENARRHITFGTMLVYGALVLVLFLLLKTLSPFKFIIIAVGLWFFFKPRVSNWAGHLHNNLHENNRPNNNNNN